MTRKLRRVYYRIIQYRLISFRDKNSMTTCWKFYQRPGRRMKSSQIGHYEGTRKFDKHNGTFELPLGTLRPPQKR